MPKKFRTGREWLAHSALICTLIVPTYARPSNAKNHDDAKSTRPTSKPTSKPSSGTRVEAGAERLVREMCAYLAAQPALRVLAEHSTEYILDDGQKLDFGGTSEVRLLRPNHLRSDRQGDFVDVSLYYDGKSIAVYGRRSALYARIGAPNNLEDAIDFAREELGLEAPAADLLTSNPCDTLMSDIVAGQLLGPAVIDGALTNHIALRGRDVDVQLWVEMGPRPLPRRYVITSKLIRGMPQHTVELTDWDVAPLFTTEMFRFSPPADAEKIDFLRKVDVSTSSH